MPTRQKSRLQEIEAAAVRGWPALETAAVDGWLWRHTSGGSVRANSVATLAFSGGDVEVAITTIEAHARRRSAPACFTVSDVSVPADIDARLAARGYVRGGDHVTMAKRVAADATLPKTVHAAKAPNADWLAIYLAGLSADRRAMAPEILARLPPTVMYVSALADGRAISSGLTIGDGCVASVQCMATLSDARRQGGAQRVLQAIEHLASRNGHTALYLQASGDNADAIALYQRAGFAVIGHYHTRTKTV